MKTKEALTEELEELKNELDSIKGKIIQLEALKDNIGEVIDFEGEKAFLTLSKRIYRLLENQGKIQKCLFKKSVYNRLKQNIKTENIKPEYILEERKLKKLKENPVDALEFLMKRSYELKTQIERLNEEINQIKKQENKEKRELLKMKNYLCDSCKSIVKKTNYVLPEHNLVLCKNCWKKPDYLPCFKEELDFYSLPKYLNLSFEDLISLEKVMKLGIFQEFIWDQPIKTVDLNKIYEAIEEGKNYLFTKELYEYLKPLDIKKSWIKEMENEGIIYPAGNIEIELKKTVVLAKLWDKRKINEEKIKRWLEEKEKTKRLNRTLAREKISKSLKEVHKFVKEKKKEKEEILNLLRTYHPFLEIAFYLYHANHYAKTPKYEKYKSSLYNLKEKVLLKGYKLYPELFKLFFIKRGHKIYLCSDCFEHQYQRWLLEGGIETGLLFKEWIQENAVPCENCDYEEDYYSLVEFKVDTPVSKFSFHLPYPNVSHFIDKTALPQIQMDKEETYIKFGRGLEKYEALVVPLKEVIKNLEKFIKN